jgi:hypothetical protein
MPLFNDFSVKLGKRKKDRSDNLTSSITPPSQGVTIYRKIRLKNNTTIDTAFTKSDFQTGNSSSSADNISLYNPKTGSFTSYYVRTSDSTWRNSANTISADVAVQNNIYVGFKRAGATSRNYTLNGEKMTSYVSI